MNKEMKITEPEDLISQVAYWTIKSLSGHKYWYESTVSDCVEHVLYQKGINLTQEEKDEVIIQCFRIKNLEERMA